MVVEWKGNLRLEAKNEKGLTVNFDAPTFGSVNVIMCLNRADNYRSLDRFA